MSDQPVPRLGGRVKLKLHDAVAQSVGLMGPVFSIAFLVPLVVGITSATGKGAGTAAALSVVIAGVGVLGLGWIVAAYARKIHSAGSLYDYVTDGLGGRVGAASGWLYYLGVLALGAAILPMIGGTIRDTIAGEWNVNPLPQSVWDLFLLILVGAVLFMGVALSTRLQLVLALTSVIVVLVFSIYVIFKSHGLSHVAQGFKTSGSSTGFSGVMFGVLYGVLLFTGFETSANLGEETEHPRRDIPRAVLYSVLAIGVFYVIGTFAQVAGFHFSLSNMQSAAANPLFALGSPGASGGFGGVWIRRLLELVVIFDMIAVLVGCSVSASRGIFALARDRRLPHSLSSVTPRATPMAGSVVVLGAYVVSILLTILTSVWTLPGLPGSLHYISVFSFLSTFGGFALAMIYVLMCVGAIFGLRDTPRTWTVWLAAAVGIAVTGGAIFGAIYKVPHPTVWAPYAALIIFAVCVASAFIRHAMSPLVTTFAGLNAVEQDAQKL